MSGYPDVRLLRTGQQLIAAAPNTAITGTSVTIGVGEQAQAMITDFSSCQAPLSDTVRVYVPGSTGYVDRPGQLRGCRSVVDPVSHG